MKNKIYTYVFVIMIFIIILMVIKVLRYNVLSIDNKIQDITWYRYNFNNGLYETLYIKNGTIKYFKPTGTNNTNSLDNCTKYNYDKNKKRLKLNCDKDIKVVSYEKTYLAIDFDGKLEKYFTNIEDSLNYEFEAYFQKSMTDYKKERNQVTEVSKINEDKLYEVLKEDEYSKIIFIGDKCSTVECTLVLDIMEKWISTNQNIYYFDINNLNDNIIKYINKISNNNYTIDYYNGAYPRVLLSKNNKIIDQYEVKCTGFNCTKYYKNEF